MLSSPLLPSFVCLLLPPFLLIMYTLLLSPNTSQLPSVPVPSSSRYRLRFADTSHLYFL